MLAKLLLVLAVCLLPNAVAFGGQVDQSVLRNANSSAPIVFTPNVGQWDDEILYRANAKGATLWFTNEGVYIQFSVFQKSTNSIASPTRLEPEKLDVELVKLSFLDASRIVAIKPSGKTDYRCNFFLGNDRSRWRTDVPNYQSITYQNIYPGIDLRYFSKDGFIEYDYDVRPGADLSRIRMKYDSKHAVALTAEGNLSVKSRLGEIAESQPLFYQDSGSRSNAQPGRFRLLEDRSISFDPPARTETGKRVTIDPIMQFSTYLGGSSSDDAYGIDVSSGGYPYVTGQTASADFPFLSEFDSTLTGTWDLFVTKFATAGNSLVYSTYIGGSGNELGRAIDEDGYGEVAVTGYTTSSNYPLNMAFDTTLGGSRDAFMTRLTSSGDGLIVSTYVGGSLNDDGFGIYADGNNFGYYVTGWTASTDFPTQNAYDASANGGNDVFAVKIGSIGGLSYGTYIGGSGNDIGWRLTIDGSRNAYIAGITASNNFPTVGAYDSTANGSNDVFACKLSSGGNSLTYSTYIGGSSDDQGLGIDIDGSGNAYVCGLTNSNNYPTASAYDASANGGYDILLTKLNSSGNGLVYSTYIGGSSHEYSYVVSVDYKGQAYLCGRTESNNFPIVGGIDSTYNGSIDAYVAKVSISGTALGFSTFLGGTGQDLGLGLAIDSYCAAYAAGSTTSTNFPTLNPYDSTRSGTYDAFVTKLTPYVCGDFNGDGLVDANDYTAFVNWFINGGAIPCPLESTDMDGDGINLTITDLIYLQNYIYRGGPAPICQ